MEFDQLVPGLRVKLHGSGPEKLFYEGVITSLTNEGVDIKWKLFGGENSWIPSLYYTKAQFNLFKDQVVGVKTTKTFKDLL